MSRHTTRSIGIYEFNNKNKFTITGFNAADTEALGTIDVELEVGKLNFNITFFIVETLSVPSIIGAPFLRKFTHSVGPCFKYIMLADPANIPANHKQPALPNFAHVADATANMMTVTFWSCVIA